MLSEDWLLLIESGSGVDILRPKGAGAFRGACGFERTEVALLAASSTESRYRTQALQEIWFTGSCVRSSQSEARGWQPRGNGPLMGGRGQRFAFCEKRSDGNPALRGSGEGGGKGYGLCMCACVLGKPVFACLICQGFIENDA